MTFVKRLERLRAGLLIAVLAGAAAVVGAQSPVQSCNATPAPAWCSAVSGDRSEGWPLQRRSEVMARNGIVATSQPLAAQAGLDILKKGGNAIDAAVATAAVLSVVEPMNVGPAGDLFAIIYIARENKLYTLNASGKAPTGATLEHMNTLGYSWDSANWSPGSGMPPGGILEVTVPGAAWGWDEVQHRFGTLTFKETLQPAIDYAEQGFPVSERIAHDWTLPKGLGPTPGNRSRMLHAGGSRCDRDVVRRTGTPRPRATSSAIRVSPGRSGSCSSRAATGSTRVRSPAPSSRSRLPLGGTMTLDDLAHYTGEWVTAANDEPSRVRRVHAAAAGADLGDRRDPEHPGHVRAAVGAGPDAGEPRAGEPEVLALHRRGQEAGVHRSVRLQRGSRISHRCRSIGCCPRPTRHRSAVASIRIAPPAPRRDRRVDSSGDTIVLSTADRWGNMVAWVNSLYMGFGSGLVVPGYGITLHNRGGLFTLDPKSPNVIAPHKRPFNTLSAGFVMQHDHPLMTVTLMGGDMQAQGIAQVLLNVLDLGANLQAASDMARFRHMQVPNVLTLESQLFALVGPQLQQMGHTVKSINGDTVGGYQAIMFTPDDASASGPSEGPVKGFYRAGSDHRKDGQAVGY